MHIDRILKEIERLGGEVEFTKRHCKFQTIFAKSIFDYCKQQKNRDYSFNLGSAGGPVICCEGAPSPVIDWEDDMDSQGNMTCKAIYREKPKHCPHYIKDGEVIGYRIILPVEAK